MSLKDMICLTKGMTEDEIIAFAAEHPEFCWKWGIFLNRADAHAFAAANDMTLEWDVPVRAGDLYLGKRNTGYKLLTARELGEACVFPVEIAYPYDFSEVVKVVS